MIARLHSWWDGLSLRERWMVGVAGALAALVVGWFLILVPLRSALADAGAAHAEAVDRHGAVMARVALLRRIGERQAPAATTPAATVDLVIGQSAAERGLALSRNEAQGEDAAAIAIANARAGAALGWIDALEAQGIVARELVMRPNADGTVALTATLARRP